MDDGIRDALLSIIAQAGKIERSSLSTATNLRRDLGLDSLALVSLLMRCGEELGIDPDELIETVPVEKINTVGDILAMRA
jgi:acyl carrier protein